MQATQSLALHSALQQLAGSPLEHDAQALDIPVQVRRHVSEQSTPLHQSNHCSYHSRPSTPATSHTSTSIPPLVLQGVKWVLLQQCASGLADHHHSAHSQVILDGLVVCRRHLLEEGVHLIGLPACNQQIAGKTSSTTSSCKHQAIERRET